MPNTKEVKGATIKSVNKYSVMSKAHIGKGEALFWHSAPWSSQIVEGFTADLVLEERDNKDKTKKEWWIASVNGQPDKVQRSGGSRGPAQADPKKLDSIERQVALKEVCLDYRQSLLASKPMSDQAFTERFNFYLNHLKDNA